MEFCWAYAFNADSASPVIASASGAALILTSKATGAASNYPFTTSSTSDNPLFTGTSFPTSPAAGSLAGGLDAGPQVYDHGTCTVTVNGTPYSRNFGQGDDPSSIASGLTGVITGGNLVTATANGATISLTSKTGGATSNYSLSSSCSYDSSNFTSPSFAASPSGSALTGGADHTPYVTLYAYDTLGNLRRVDQKGSAPTDSTKWRTRTFTYDSLSRLVTANNPESGTLTYSYDTVGNLLQKTSPAPNQTGSATQTISHCYDELNRPTGRAYSAQTCANGRLPSGTAVVSYVYDADVNAKGKLTSLTDQAGTASYTYDIMGRMATEQRAIAGVSKTVSYEYNLDGSLKVLHYPSGAAVTYTPDSAGRALSAVDVGNSINYVTSATYGPDGSLTGFVSGNTGAFAGITNAFSYNNRLQPALRSASSPSQTVFSIGYDFHLGNGNNGNVFAIANNRDSTRNQTFTYDALNRLASAQNTGTDCSVTVGGKTKFWGNAYGYDAWGNLLSKTVTKCGGESLSVTAGSDNRLQGGYTYDAAGNMTHDAASGANYTYDQENRLSGAAGYAYTYDAAGNRVKKSNGSTGTLYWHMAPGVVAESDLTGAIQSEYVFFDGDRVARRDGTNGAGGVFYYFSDHLKTASVITDSEGNIKAESDYYPWGGEIQFVNNDSNHYKFGSKERDNETGLDYFLARYYSSTQGRFTSPDEFQGGPLEVFVLGSGSPTKQALPYADIFNPQSLNKYQFTYNNPLRYVDPDGHDADPDPQDQDGKRLNVQEQGVVKTAGAAAGCLGNPICIIISLLADPPKVGGDLEDPNSGRGPTVREAAKSEATAMAMTIILPKGLRATSGLFSGVRNKVASEIGQVVGREVSLTDHAVRRVIERVFTKGAELSGVTIQQLGQTLKNGAFFLDQKTGSYVALGKSGEAVAFILQKGKIVIRTIEKGSNVAAGDRFKAIARPF